MIVAVILFVLQVAMVYLIHVNAKMDTKKMVTYVKKKASIVSRLFSVA